jgi:hypothetical protein
MAIPDYQVCLEAEQREKERLEAEARQREEHERRRAEQGQREQQERPEAEQREKEGPTRLLRKLEGHSSRVFSVAFSLDGALIARDRRTAPCGCGECRTEGCCEH